jgi:hypothetical protein
MRTSGTGPSRCSRRTATLPDRSVPHQRHQQARRGGCGREHDGYCESAQMRPVAPPVGGLRRTRRAVMHPMRSGVEVGRQGHGMHFSRCASTDHTRGDVREPPVRPDRWFDEVRERLKPAEIALSKATKVDQRARAKAMQPGDWPYTSTDRRSGHWRRRATTNPGRLVGGSRGP